MISIFVFLISFFSFSSTAVPLHWSYILEIKEVHEFYAPNEEIKHPKDSWQLLFSLVYLDRELNKLKDCVYYLVPGSVSGVLKLKTISASDKCENHLLAPGDMELNDMKSLYFAASPKDVTIDFSTKKLRTYKWRALVQEKFIKPTSALHKSSSEMKSPKMILLAPVTSNVTSRLPGLKDKTLCHDVSEECVVNSQSRCHECENGWYEVPNGCAQGPKFCGILRCGDKGQPACRRGMKWQKKESSFDCRTDASFAFCRKGLIIACEGKRTFCR